MKTILLYSGIYNFVAESFINQLNEIPKDEDLTIRLNSPGGSVFAGWGMIAALKERTGRTILKVDGHAASMAFLFSLYFDEVYALDVTRFMIHRATGYVSNADDKKVLDDINADIRQKLEKKIDIKQFEKITKVTIDELFEGSERRDVWVSAKEAKKIGLVSKVVRLDPKEIAAINEKLVAITEFEEFEPSGIEESSENTQGSVKVEKQQKNNLNINEKVSKMTKQEVQTQHPEVYAAVVAEGRLKGIEAGVSQERTRVKSYMAYLSVDNEYVIKAIKEGTEFTTDVMAELNVKLASSKTLENIEKDNPGETTTVTPDAKKEEDEKFKADLDKITKSVSL